MIIVIEINKLYVENCMETMRKIEDKSVDLIIADPPYFRILKNDWDNQWKTEKEYYLWCREWLKEFRRIIKPNGSVYIWNWFDNICSIGHFAKDEGFIIRNLITWNRGGGREKKNWGSKKEDLLYLSLTETPIFNLEDILISPNDPNRKMSKSAWERGKYERKGRKDYNNEKANPSNVWYDSMVSYNSKENVNHPSQKPLSICERIIKGSSNENDLVYIPFAGSGSEIEACINTKRNWIASEISEEYVNDIILPRITKSRILKASNINVFSG